MKRTLYYAAAIVASLCVIVLPAPVAIATELSGEKLVTSLRGGGYIIYFRHAPTNWSQQDRLERDGDWKSCDGDLMRQLSNDGREMARRIGEAMRSLDIPVGRILSSEYCRAADTARLLNFGEVRTTLDIMNLRAAEFVGGHDAVVRRARRVLSTPPQPGTNTVIAGHGNIMRAATDAYAAEGGSGVYLPDRRDRDGFRLVARLAPQDWIRLAEQFADDS